MTWSSAVPVPPGEPVDPGLAASAAALLSALVREEPRPPGPVATAAAAVGTPVPPQRTIAEEVPAAGAGVPPERRKGRFGRR